MRNTAKKIEIRDIFFSELESRLDKKEAVLTLYFRKEHSFKGILVSGKLRGILGENLITVFSNLNPLEYKNQFNEQDFKEFYSCYEDVQKSIKSNSSVEIIRLLRGFLGPKYNFRVTNRYSTFDEIQMKSEDVKEIFEELNTDNDFMTVNDVATEYYNLLNYDNIINEDGISENEEIIEEEIIEEIQNETYSRNMIFFGSPGTGKSYQMIEHAKNISVKGDNIFRTTFHPEYSYYDFIGQYKPVVGHEEVTTKIVINRNVNNLKPFIYYDFVPGVFTNAVISSLKNSSENTLLIIEEINRGNCASIFGDVFQLLDRNMDIESRDFGSSQYSIEISLEFKEYIIKSLEWNNEKWKEKFPEGFKIPKNLFIYATMNTSDQSLFPMDSAFKRRWAMSYVAINYNEIKLLNIHLPTPNENITWLKFIKIINKKIVEYTLTDDKQLGQWFIKTKGDKISQSDFIGKLLSYLWFDIFRQDPNIIFKDEIKTYDNIINNYESGIIREEILQEMTDEQNNN